MMWVLLMCEMGREEERIEAGMEEGEAEYYYD